MYVVDMRHDYCAEPEFEVYPTFPKAVEAAHLFFLSYDFAVQAGHPVDSDGRLIEDCEMYKGKVWRFMHAGGDGPYCNVVKAKNK